MSKHLFFLSILCVIAFISCKKDLAMQTSSDNTLAYKITEDNLITNSAVSSAHWYGSYVNAISDPDDPDFPNGFPDSISDADFISGGVARLPNIDYHASFDYSKISFNIPSDYTVIGDSITFQTVAETTGGTGDFLDNDVVLQIVGSQHLAELHFVGDASGQQSDQYYVGNTRYYNLPQLVHSFGSFQTVKWVMKKDGTAAYINGKLAYKFSYGATNHIGRIQTISVEGNGYVTVNSVNLLNSYTNKKVLTENFTVDGQSHTIFY